MRISLKQEIIKFLERLGNKNPILIVQDIIDDYLKDNIKKIEDSIKLSDSEKEYLQILKQELEEKRMVKTK
jgi:hypothetical protein